MAVKYMIAVAFLVSLLKLGLFQTGPISCNEELTAQNHQTILLSPNYPNDYPNNLNCVIHIQSVEGTVIELEFKAFDLEEDVDCGKDALMIYDGIDGTQQLIRHPCGTYFKWPLYPDIVRSSGNAITLNFITDAEDTSSGYYILYKRGNNANTFKSSLVSNQTGILQYQVISRPEIFVIAAEDRNRLHVIQRHNALSHELIPDGLQSPQAVDYDPVEGYVYYSDKESKIIGRVLLSGESTQILHQNDISNPIALRIDVINRLLYWSDSDLAAIFVSSLGGSKRQSLIDSELHKPGAIALEPNKGYMYFTDWGHPAKIERAEGDGTNRLTLVSTRISSPQGLAIDLNKRYLYWVDTLLDTLEAVDVFGNNRVTLKQFNERDPFALVLDDDGFFFTDEEFGAIEMLERDSLETFRVYIEDIREPRGMTLRQINEYGESVPYTCPRNDCQGLCLPRAHDHYTCVRVDDINPVILNCPKDIIRHTSTEEAVRVDWAEPTASDNSGSVTLSLAEGPLPGSALLPGTFTITYLAVDPTSNIATCSFTVRVIKDGKNSAAGSSNPKGAFGLPLIIFGSIISALLLLVICVILFLSWRCRRKLPREMLNNISLTPTYDNIPEGDSNRIRPISSISLGVANGSAVQYSVQAPGTGYNNDMGAIAPPPPYEVNYKVDLSDEKDIPPRYTNEDPCRLSG